MPPKRKEETTVESGMGALLKSVTYHCRLTEAGYTAVQILALAEKHCGATGALR
jgi:hypothetical protein